MFCGLGTVVCKLSPIAVRVQIFWQLKYTVLPKSILFRYICLSARARSLILSLPTFNRIPLFIRSLLLIRTVLIAVPTTTLHLTCIMLGLFKTEIHLHALDGTVYAPFMSFRPIGRSVLDTFAELLLIYLVDIVFFDPLNRYGNIEVLIITEGMEGSQCNLCPRLTVFLFRLFLIDTPFSSGTLPVLASICMIAFGDIILAKFDPKFQIVLFLESKFV